MSFGSVFKIELGRKGRTSLISCHHSSACQISRHGSFAYDILPPSSFIATAPSTINTNPPSSTITLPGTHAQLLCFLSLSLFPLDHSLFIHTSVLPSATPTGSLFPIFLCLNLNSLIITRSSIMNSDDTCAVKT